MNRQLSIHRVFALSIIGLLALLMACFSLAEEADTPPTSIAPTPTPGPLRELKLFIEPRDCTSFILDPQPEKGSKYVEGTSVTISLVPAKGCTVKEWINVDSFSGLSGRLNMNADRIVQINLVRASTPALLTPAVGQEPTPTPTPKPNPAPTATPVPVPAPTATATPVPTSTPTGDPGLISSGYDFEFQYACINRTLSPCILLEGPSGMFDRIWERTNGQINIQLSSFPELGLAGPDTLRLIEDGTLAMAEIYGGYVLGELPIVDIVNLWGLIPDTQTNLAIVDAVRDPIHRILEERSNGVILGEMYYPNNYFFAQKPLRTGDDFDRMKIRIYNTMLDDLLSGMGADPQFMPFAEVYTGLERGIIDAALTCGTCGAGLRWFEVSDYLVGPIHALGVTYITVNKDLWDEIPADLQAIMREEAVRHQEAGRLLVVNDWAVEGIDENVERGMEYIEFTPGLKEAFRQAAIDQAVPNWVSRNGGPNSDAVIIFNEKVGPIVGIKINADGTVVEITPTP